MADVSFVSVDKGEGDNADEADEDEGSVGDDSPPKVFRTCAPAACFKRSFLAKSQNLFHKTLIGFCRLSFRLIFEEGLFHHVRFFHADRRRNSG